MVFLCFLVCSTVDLKFSGDYICGGVRFVFRDEIAGMRLNDLV